MFMKTPNIIAVLLLFMAGFAACKKDKQIEPEKPVPTIRNIEVGLNNNEIGVIGRDFHLNFDVLAGSRIENVQIKILQRSGETYAKPWKHEITWDQYKDAKNATVHKHFNIPDDAVEGNYDFVITINDQNGSQLEEKRKITIYNAANLPIDLKLDEFSVSARSATNRVMYILTRGGYRDPVTLQYGDYRVKIGKGEVLSAAATISGIKGDGQIYILLINKKHNHRPESIKAIDFSKAIVVDVFSHKDMANTQRWSHVNAERTGFPEVSRLLIGSPNDNNSPTLGPITGLKAWESDEYYVGMIYNNTTHNMSMFHYMETAIEL